MTVVKPTFAELVDHAADLIRANDHDAAIDVLVEMERRHFALKLDSDGESLQVKFWRPLCLALGLLLVGFAYFVR
jgi:hypothetical protein